MYSTIKRFYCFDVAAGICKVRIFYHTPDFEIILAKKKRPQYFQNLQQKHSYIIEKKKYKISNDKNENYEKAIAECWDTLYVENIKLRFLVLTCFRIRKGVCRFLCGGYIYFSLYLPKLK